VRWSQGEAIIERLIAAGQLQSVSGSRADGKPWLDKASTTLASAQQIADRDPDSAYVLAYDAARQACGALLAQQGLRPTTAGGHYAVEEAVRAQFGHRFRPFGTLRRRRNELEYPTHPGERADADEARAALAEAQTIIEAAAQILPHLGIF
jgi:hypothetical protein